MNKQPILTPDQIADEQIGVMCRVFSTADRTLSHRAISVKADRHEKSAAPAWNDGSTITFNLSKIGGVLTVEDIVRINGLNYHELSHIFYTPRRNTTLVSRISDEGLHNAFNALEDQRIETLFTARFAGTTPYFVSIIMSYIVAEPTSWPHVFPLLHGRRYLDPAIRQEMEARYSLPGRVKRLREVIDEYRLIAKPELDIKRSLELCREYALLCSYSTQRFDPFGHMARVIQVQQGQPVDGVEQEDAVREAIRQEGEQNASADEQQGVAQGDPKDADRQQGDGPGQDGQDGQDGQSDGQGSSGRSGADDADGNGKSGKGDGESDQPGGLGIGTQPGSHMTTQDIVDRAREAINGVRADPDVIRDARDKQRTIVKGDGKTLPQVDAKSFSKFHPSASDVNVVRKFYRELERLARDLDPGLLTHRSSGRINVKRVMQGSPRDEIFDEWQEGRNESAQMEVVVLLDYSGSMDSQMRGASTVMWTIKRAVEMVGREASVTCIGFDTGATLLYGSNDRADANVIRLFGSQGGTDPHDALSEAARIFHNTRRTNRVLMMVTDGIFPGTNNDPLIERFNAAGVLTGMVYLGAATTADEWFETRYRSKPTLRQAAEVEWNGLRHGCTVFSAVRSTTDLIPFAKELVKQAMRASR